jgi:hypothetical protein
MVAKLCVSDSGKSLVSGYQEDRVLRIFGCKKAEVTGAWRKLH